MQRKKEIIVVTLEDQHSYKNPFNENKLSQDLSNYILEECKGLNYNDELELHIKTKFDISREEKVNIINMIRSNYGIDVRENVIYREHLIKKNILLFIFGCLFIAYSFFIEDVSATISEIILIIGWVGIWEVVYSIFFSEYKKRMEIKRLKQLTNSRIIFFK